MDLFEKIGSLAKRRGFIYPGSEIYGGLAGIYDYGPLGAALKNNIRDSWIRFFVFSRDNMYLIDSAILMNPKVWEASKHVTSFIDPLVDDLVTKKRYRADHILEENGVDAGKMTIEEMDAEIKKRKLKSPDGNPLSDVRKFNLMLETKIGAVEETAVRTYLRPEEAQGVFVNFKNVRDSFSPKLPFGIAQVGKAFRNEVTPRDFTYRMREFEIVELEYFFNPKNAWEPIFDDFLSRQKKWLGGLGVDVKKLHPFEHPETARAHYSKKTVDLNFEYPFGTKELTGLAHRSDYDLSQHQKNSKQSMEILDEETREKFIPHVIEPTVSLDRAVLAVLVSAYVEDKVGDETRTVLRFPPNIAPCKVAVFPLLANKPKLVELAKKIYDDLKKDIIVAWDDRGNIGKRYRAQDEAGTPFCVTVDFDSLEKGDVTVRDRDSMKQERVKIKELAAYLKERLN